jgi:short-subunit dehydrogenase
MSASSGISEAFAKILAARGKNLLLVARSEDKLHAMAQALSEQYGIRAECVPINLCSEDAAQEVYRQTQALGMTIGLFD